MKEISDRNNFVSAIFFVIIGIIILLFGMKFTSFLWEGVVASLMNLFWLILSIIFISFTTRIDSICGRNTILVSVVLCCFIAIFNIVVNINITYADFLNGNVSSLSNHYEHSLMYSEMSTIANRLSQGATIDAATQGLPLNQYFYIFTYCSFMFLIGGINVTNMAIWGTLHLYISAIFVTLTAEKLSGYDSPKMSLVYFCALFQPLFWSVGTYNKVIIGEAIVMLALYIYISTYKNLILNTLFFPVYAFLFWMVRTQYILIAIILYIFVFVISRRNITIGKFVVSIVALGGAFYICSTVDITSFFMEDANVSGYTVGSNYSPFAIIQRALRSFFPYFPWTNLILRDEYWTFNMYVCLQEAVNLAAWGLLFLDSWRRKAFSQLFKNPLFIAAGLFLISGFLSEVHATYLSVGTMVLPIMYGEIDAYQYKRAVNLCILFYFIFSLFYELLGLSGAGILNF